MEENKFDIEWMMKQITPRGNGKTLRSAKPKDGIAAFVWRMLRFHSGEDLRYPVHCYFDLAIQMEKDTDKHFSIGIFGDYEKEILDKLDLLVIECSNRLGLSQFEASKTYRALWG